MDYKVVMLNKAERDLCEILDYKTQFYPGTADRFIDEFKKKRESIAENPYMYQVYIHNKKYRRAIVLDYLMFYRVFDQSNIVRIYRILNGKIDLNKYI